MCPISKSTNTISNTTAATRPLIIIIPSRLPPPGRPNRRLLLIYNSILFTSARFERLLRRLDEPRDILLQHGGGQERGLELRRRPVDAPRQQLTEPRAKLCRVGGFDGRVVRDGGRLGKKYGDHGTNLIDDDGDVGVSRPPTQSLRQRLAEGLQAVVDLAPALPQQCKHLQARRHRQRIAGERSRLVDWADRRDGVHDLGPAAVG